MSTERQPVTCSTGRLPNGHTVLMGQIGYKKSGQPAVFLWCRFHRRAHSFTLDQMLQTFRSMSAGDEQWRQQYITILNKAIMDVMADGTMEQKQESA